jgi:hypothetical protein
MVKYQIPRPRLGASKSKPRGGDRGLARAGLPFSVEILANRQIYGECLRGPQSARCGHVDGVLTNTCCLHSQQSGKNRRNPRRNPRRREGPLSENSRWEFMHRILLFFPGHTSSTLAGPTGLTKAAYPCREDSFFTDQYNNKACKVS